MRKSDPWEVRAQDVAYALARTAAHETGHGLGLVGLRTDEQCAWMGGINEQRHHGVRDEEGKQLDKRYGGGKFIMDAGDLVMERYRIGEPQKGRRINPGKRLPLQFGAFDMSYLQLLYPLE